MKERLQKLLAQANIASRRASEELISHNRVRVNGEIAKLGDKADPNTDVIEVDGTALHFDAKPHVYIALNKPKQVLSTDKPHRGDQRDTVSDLIHRDEHLFSIGRLDADSEGLVVMTNDGDLAQRLSHPRYRHTKTYRVEVLGLPTAETLEKWQEGLFLEDGKTAPCFVEITKGSVKITTLRIVMTEGKKRQIRRIAAALGHPVRRLVRTHIGMLSLGDLEPGQSRPLSMKEVIALSTPSPEIKTIRGAQAHRSASAKTAPGAEVKPVRQHTRRVSRLVPADETEQKSYTPREKRLVSTGTTPAKYRSSRATASDAVDEASTKRRTPRFKKPNAPDDSPIKRRVSRAKPVESADEAPRKRRTSRGQISVTAENIPTKRRTSRSQTSVTSDDPPIKRRTSRVKPAASADEAPTKRRTPRVKKSDAPGDAQDKRRIPRRKKSDAHDDKWGKPTASRARKPRVRKDQPR